MPQVESSKLQYPAITEAAKKSNGTSYTALVPVVTSISDILIPGLGVTIGVVLALIKQLCKRLLKRKHEKLQYVSKRMASLYDLAKRMEKQGRFLPSEWLMRYRDLVVRFQEFMVRCEEKHVLLRIMSGGKENKEVRGFEEQVDGLYGSMDFQERRGGGCCVQ